ncbi:MAG TPA: FN3 associated domain-containing protein, partial [Spirochaetota bacterium]|nr:FN3 associated domain-containing protein [Spirochaetota bacterium]
MRRHVLNFILMMSAVLAAAGCGSSIQNAQDFKQNQAPIVSNFTVEYIGTDTNYNPSKLYSGMPFIVKVQAADPEKKNLNYSITSEKGTFSTLTEDADGISCRFYIGTITPGDPVRISLVVTDPKNASYSQSIDVGTGKRGPGLTVVQPTSSVIVPDDSTAMTVSCDSKGVFCVYRSTIGINKDQAVLGTSVLLYDSENEKVTVPILGPASQENGSVRLVDGESNYVWVVFRDNNGMTDSYLFPMSVDSVSPVVLSTYPADQSVNISRKPGIRILFNKALNASTVNASNITVTSSDGSSVPGSVTYDPAEHIAAFTPASDLSNNVKYTVKISKNITDEVAPSGNPMPLDCSFSFTVVPDGVLSVPEFFPVPGTYVGSRSVSIVNSDPLAKIIYTDDGITVPKIMQNANGSYTVDNGSEYTGPLTVAKKTTIRALAYRDGTVASDSASAEYNIKAAAPVFTESAKNAVTGALTLSMKTATSGGAVYYTTDGANPSSSGKLLGTGQTIAVTKNMTVRAVTKADGMSDSDQTSTSYTVRASAPVFSVADGSYETDQYLFISSDSGATIYYTMSVNGTEPDAPTTASDVFPLGKKLPGTTTGTSYWLKAIAYKNGELVESAVSSAKITVNYGT